MLSHHEMEQTQTNLSNFLKANVVKSSKTKRHSPEKFFEGRYPGVLPASRKSIVDVRFISDKHVIDILEDPNKKYEALSKSEQAIVQAFAKSMEQGRWVFNGQPLVFEITSPGKWRVVNGLKRLLALYFAKKKLPFVFVVFGSALTGKPDWYLEASVDAHRRRRTADYVSLLEPHRARTISAALAHIFYWKSGTWKQHKANTYDILKLFVSIPNIKNTTEEFFEKYSSIPGPRPLLLAFYIMTHIISKESSERFFSGVAQFASLSHRDPRRMLAAKLWAIAEGGAQASRQELHFAFARAWQAFCENAPIAVNAKTTAKAVRLYGWEKLQPILEKDELPASLVRLFGQEKDQHLEHIRASLVTVTPDGAKYLLKNNTWNRAPSPVTVNKFVRDMKEGRWVFNGSALVLSEKGRLLDGQQRLMAIVEAGTPQDFVLVEGVNEAAFATIDNSPSRGFVYVLRGMEVPYYNSAAAAVNILCRVSRQKNEKNYLPSSSEMLEFFRTHEEGLRKAAREQGSDESGLSPGVATALRYVTDIENPKKAAEFFRKLSGLGEFHEGDPVLALQRALTKNRQGGEVGKAPPMERFYWGVEAWNLFLHNKKIKHFRPNKNNASLAAKVRQLIEKAANRRQEQLM